jgi:hypothetical protein
MGRLIEVQDAQLCQSPLAICQGDLLCFYAVGGRVNSGGASLEKLGPFQQAVIGEQGDVIAAQGAPNRVLFLARRPGQASVDITTGDPWGSTQNVQLEIVVQSC